MENKTFVQSILGMFLLVVLAGISSAALSATVVSVPSNINRDAGSFDIVFNLTNTGAAGDINWSTSTVTSGAALSFNDSTIGDGLVTPVTEQIKATVTFPSNITAGSISGVLRATLGVAIVSLPQFNVLIKEPEEVSSCFITGDKRGNLDIRRIKFSNGGISGASFGDDSKWYALNEIDAEIEIRNRGNERIEDIEVQWGLFDTDANKWVIEPREEKEFDLRDGKTETLSFTFDIEEELEVDLDELKDGDNYLFYVIANGIDNDEAVLGDVCTSKPEKVEIVVERDLVVLEDIRVPELASCGETVSLTAKAWNIGSRDQDELYVQIFNAELGVNERVDFEEISAFNDENLDVVLTIPKTAQEKTYNLRFNVYDENGDLYESDSDESEFFVPVVVRGNCASSSAKANILANILSGGKAGEPLVVQSTITNTGTGVANYTVSVSGYNSWASSAVLSQNSFTVDKDNSKQFTVTFDVNPDASGDKSFNIEVASNGQLALTQPASVTIEGKTGFSNITGRFTEGNRWIWVIGLLNVILIIIIIIVAVRIMRR